MKKILIYRNVSLGDFINSTPALKLIKKLNPNSKIYYATQKKSDVGFVTPDLLPLKKNMISKFIFFKYNFFSILIFLIKIALIKFDKLYYFNEFKTKSKENRDHLLFKLFKIKEIYGFNKGNFNYLKFNETFYLCKIVKKDIKKNEVTFFNIFKEYKKDKKKFITISLGGRDKRKVWNFQYWKLLIRKIVHKFPNLKIIIVGSKNEVTNANLICKINKHKIKSMCGKTTVKSLFKLINSSKYHISHDDGTMHVASVYNKPGAVIFGLTSYKGKWRPMSKNLRIFYPKKNINETKPKQVFKKIINDLKKI